MPILRSSPPSPFSRKVRIAFAVAGLDDTLTVESVDTRAPAPSFFDENPLGKIPVLVLDGGSTLFDSAVIIDYVDHLAGGGVLVPSDPAGRFRVLRLQALADGMMDAALLQIYEVRYRPEARRHSDWVAWQAGKVARALDTLELAPPREPDHAFTDAGSIALACALGYLDLRFDGRWRKDHPALVAWLDAFAAAVPAFAATDPEGR
ncbi:Glutathione S-transferase [Pseudoxanthobacter soli DSM 19599]|uniref:Glutathione S-transferase n=1 Tax=Pseudoxanthobacter soli DSM 19599 TaxID=1123029 RepID=A0A1M7ZD33_9HYPH|nr:glutathione S-transferase family protein [Pseudoxanthobacter soli]SHO62616.1 Glutathione S-transferase [Pseudoxanthobacter soli DSM 19599]